MEQTQLTSKSYFTSLKIIHFALTAGIAFFMLIAITLQFTGFEPELKEMEMILLGITVFAAASGIFTGNLLFRKRLEQLVELKSLEKKLLGYQSALILKYALVEGPAFFTIVGYLMTANIMFPVITVLLIFTMVLFAPRKDKLISDLNLSNRESAILENQDAVIE
ncbi:MAG: hypothetical protein AB7S72_06155 [Draconibacterium sp.]